MNKVITDGLSLMPPPFAAGLSAWSSGDGTPGSPSYAGAGGGVIVPADQDFGGCLELVKTAGTQAVRWMGHTPLPPGLYLRVTARVKCLSGSLPSVRIAATPVTAGEAVVAGLVGQGPAVAIPSYGAVVEVSAILSRARRSGVAMAWGVAADHAHVGLDLTGPNGGLVRVDDLVVEDVTDAFVYDLMGLVDVRDYGAIGDGVANDAAAFAAADAAAAGRTVLVPAGTWRVDGDVTFQNRVRFEGRVVSPAGRRFVLTRDFDLDAYIEAFGNEETAFRKAYQALLNFSDHDSLDLCGRRIGLTAPLDMQGAEPALATFTTRRVIRNGQVQALPGPGWADGVTTSQGTYSAASPYLLTGVANASAVEVGSLVTGNGVGREVYVRDVDVASRTVTLSAQLYDAVGTQPFTFRRFRYLLDFGGYAQLSSMVLDDVELLCDGNASGIMLAPSGSAFQVRDCTFTKPKDRAITSVGTGCQGLHVDRCQFLSNEQGVPVQNRTTLCFNVNANDPKIRDNRVVRFKHFCVLQSTGSLISGNHWFLGDDVDGNLRRGGVILTVPNCASFITGNYIDNNFIEWTNEHDATPTYASQFSFGGLTVTGNLFLATQVAPWFRFIVIKPYGTGHFVDGLAVIGNVFRTIGASNDRVEMVDTTFADLDYGRMRNVTFAANTFDGVVQEVHNPLSLTHAEASPTRTWAIDTDGPLPFRGRARTVEAVVPVGHLRDGAGADVFEAPTVDVEQGGDRRQVELGFRTAVQGKVRISVRMDNPY